MAYTSTPTPRVENTAYVLSCLLKFVHAVRVSDSKYMVFAMAISKFIFLKYHRIALGTDLVSAIEESQRGQL